MFDEPRYEVTGSLFGKRFNECVSTLAQARSIVIKLSAGTIWYYANPGRRVQVETRMQAICSGAKGVR
jgi:hypothetical protein